MHEPEIHTSLQLTHDQQTPTRSIVTVNAKVEEEIGKIIGNYFFGGKDNWRTLLLSWCGGALYGLGFLSVMEIVA